MKQTLPKNHDQIVTAITKNLSPVRPVNIKQLFLSWLVLCLILAIIGAFLLGIRSDITWQLYNTQFWIRTSTLALLFLFYSLAAIKSAIPGRQFKKITFLFTLLAFVSFFTFYFNSQPATISSNETSQGWDCTVCLFALSIFPLAVFTYFLSKYASFHPYLTASLAAIAAFSLGAFSVYWHCPNNQTDHLFIWHDLPTFLFSIGLAYFSQTFLKRWKKTKALEP